MDDRFAEKVADELSQLCYVAADIEKQLERIAIMLECIGEAAYGIRDKQPNEKT